MPQNNLKGTDETWLSHPLTADLCDLSGPHPDSAMSRHVTQAARPGTRLTSELTACRQKGQVTVPEVSVRYAGKMGTGRGWVTTTGAHAGGGLRTGGVTPTGRKV